jgi:hypothetical protein
VAAQITVDIRPIELDGKYFIDVVIAGSKTAPHGPFSDADEAEAAANRLLRFSRALTSSHPSGASKWAK